MQYCQYRFRRHARAASPRPTRAIKSVFGLLVSVALQTTGRLRAESPSMILWSWHRRLDLDQGPGVSPTYFAVSEREGSAQIYLFLARGRTGVLWLWVRRARGNSMALAQRSKSALRNERKTGEALLMPCSGPDFSRQLTDVARLGRRSANRRDADFTGSAHGARRMPGGSAPASASPRSRACLRGAEFAFCL